MTLVKTSPHIISSPYGAPYLPFLPPDHLHPTDIPLKGMPTFPLLLLLVSNTDQTGISTTPYIDTHLTAGSSHPIRRLLLPSHFKKAKHPQPTFFTALPPPLANAPFPDPYRLYPPTHALRWTQTPAYYTDGSAKPHPNGGTETGAAFYYTEDRKTYTVNPQGFKETNTITRAEAAGIEAALSHATNHSGDITIFCDSLTVIYNILKALYYPDSLTEIKHAPLLLAIRSRILQRARNHTNIAIIKVKSHTGIHGNDLADLGANVARSLPTKCDYSCDVQPEHFIHLPGWPCLPMDQDDAEEPWFAPDLNASLKKHMFDNCRHITDGSRASTSLTYAKIQHLVDKSLPIYFTALWTMGLPFSQTRNILKTLTNTLWTAKKAQQMNKPYKSAAGVITNGHCPLCSHPNDTPGHILGGCDHPTFKGCYIARHNQATCTLNTAIDTGRLGACFTIMDVTSTDNLPFGVFDSRIPRWMVPAIPPHFPPDFDLKKLRPDILKVEGLPHTDFLQLQAAGLLYCDTTMTTLKSKCIIHPFEVGYTSEFSHSSCLASKQQQHVLLIELFQYNGWTVFTTPVPPPVPTPPPPPPPTFCIYYIFHRMRRARLIRFLVKPEKKLSSLLHV
jgi:ribonuclease HI